MNETKKYCIISHTHWDREWYLPLENFRMRLVDLIDHLLEILDTDPEYRFHLDAQTIVLEDYLEIRPKRRPALEKYIKEGRILVGPWYVQNDFHLTSGEATVRNLLIGTAIANEFGACMKVGYAADQFGLISQLPQILSRYGLDYCVFGRGFDRHETQFYWEAEDGSKVQCEHMRFWYNNAQRFSPDPVGALHLARERASWCAQHAKTHNYLLMNGVDHLEAQEDLTEIIKKVRPMLSPDEELFQDTLPEFMDRVKSEIEENHIKLETFRGEFRDNGADNCLTGTLSSRIYLKQWNARCQAALEKIFEPLYSVNTMLGLTEYPTEYSTYMWKLLIQNHPHDSICGCSVDAVHAHMMDRFKRVRENVTDLISRGTDILLNHTDRDGLSDNQYLVLCMNSTQLPFRSVMDAVIEIPTEEDTGSFTISHRNGKEVPFCVSAVEKNVSKSILSPINLPGERRVNRYTVHLLPGTVPGMSFRTLTVTPTEGTLAVSPLRRKISRRMENEFLRVELAGNGTITLTEKKSGAVYRDLLLLEDNTERGNSYQHRENDGSEIVTSENVKAKITVEEDNAFVQKRRIAYTMKIDHVTGSGSVPVEITLTLARGARTLDVAVRLTNTVKNHRLRMHFPTDISADRNYAGQPFDCLIRDKVSRFDNDKCHPDTDYVGVEDGTRGFAVLNCGIYEYEQLTDERDTLALTLLRANEIISGEYETLTTMNQDWTAPENQCLGEQTYHLALYPYTGSHTEAQVAARAQQFIAPPYTAVQPVDRNKFIGGRPFVQGPGMPDIFTRPLPHAEIKVPHDMTALKIESSIPEAMILSAFKGAEERDGSYIVRLYNTTSEEVDCTLTFAAKLSSAALALLNETETEALPIRRAHTVSIHALPKQIVTLRIR